MRKLIQAIVKERGYYDSVWQMIYLSDYMNWFHAICNNYYKYKEMLNRMIYWGWNMRWSWDFDAMTLYEITRRKLERCNKVFENNGHLVWNSDRDNKLMKELRECILLFKRLEDDDYNLMAYDEMQEKYKDYPKHKPDWFEKIKFETAAEEEAYSKEYRRRQTFWSNKRKVERRRAFHLLEKNLESWWD